MINLSPRSECEGNAFWSVCLPVHARNSKAIAPIDLIFFIQEDDLIWTKEFIKEPLRGRTKYQIKVHHGVKPAL